jgi:mannitol/fructose-specific phosphotransferase system IIA component (Ntr-type)
MKLTDFFHAKSVIAELESTDRDGVLREMVQSLADQGAIDPGDVEQLAQSAIDRENQGSTGFGKGVAVPHVKHPKVKSLLATIGRSTRGVDFAALDRGPVFTVFLLLSPQDDPDGHLEAMEKIFRHLQRDTFRRHLRQAETTDAMVELIEEADEAG